MVLSRAAHPEGGTQLRNTLMRGDRYQFGASMFVAGFPGGRLQL
jgi:hypothetical protein